MNEKVINKLTAGWQGFAVLLLNTIVILGLFEVAAGALLQQIEEGEAADVRATLSYYQTVDWGDEYWIEHGQRRNIYYPYVIWRRQQQSGQQINVGEDGVRHTPNTNCDEADAYTIFTFGGSTMWGSGSPDSMTIPAYLQQQLGPSLDKPLCIINYGEGAWNSTQSTIQLLMLLKMGDIPDVVVFYDGGNDIAFTRENNQRGIHHKYDQFVERFSDTPPPLTIIDLIEATNIFKLASELTTNGQVSAAENVDRIADLTLKEYFSNYRIVNLLAGEYEFEYLFFWQPLIFVTDKPFTEEEQEMYASVSHLAEYYQTTYDLMHGKASEYEHLYLIDDAFNNIERGIYIDWIHTVPEGNRFVAKRMANVIEQHIE